MTMNVRKVQNSSKKESIKFVFIVMFFCVLFINSILLEGCEKEQESDSNRGCHVVLEEHDAFDVDQPARTVKRGEDLVYTLSMKGGYALKSVDYPDYEIQGETAGKTTVVVLKNVRYSVTIKAEVVEADIKIQYDANGGRRLDGQDERLAKTIFAWDTHARINTSIGTDLFERDGYTLTGWNTSSDGSGKAVGLGSRIDVTDGLYLYAQWSKWTDAGSFTYETKGEQIVITGYSGNETVITIPAQIEDKPVISIGEEAFADVDCETVILPITLQTMEKNAFDGAGMSTIYIYDNIVTFDDYCFQACSNLKTLHINAVEKPVFSNNYFATFADKYDRLLALQNEKKLVLFSGSSTRFGYDSEKLESAFPEYQVVNMGVFAYSNATPQLMLILDCMKEGDILLDAPEFDAAKRQFCTSLEFDDSFFCMIEADYDLISKLDLRQFQKTFSSFHTYLTVKSGMEAKDYGMTPVEFNEDGVPVEEESYNVYGDYILKRPNASDDTPIYGLEVPYTKEAFPEEIYLKSINEMYQRFLDRKIRVYFTYAPRNEEAISKESTFEKRVELDTYFQDKLIVPVISNLEESLYPGRYLYGTDNHLSSEGVQIRTQRIISDLSKQFEKEEQINE